jgi:hypothetical protein
MAIHYSQLMESDMPVADVFNSLMCHYPLLVRGMMLTPLIFCFVGVEQKVACSTKQNGVTPDKTIFDGLLVSVYLKICY